MALRIQSLYDRDVHPPLDGFEPSLTQQHFANEVDINAIMARAERGIAPPTRRGSPVFGDFSGIVDYQTSLAAVVAADEAFDALPASVRIRFDNDPALLLDFVRNPINRDEAVKLGLVNAPVEPVEPPKMGAPVLGPAPILPVSGPVSEPPKA